MKIRLTRKGNVVKLECSGTIPDIDIETPDGISVRSDTFYGTYVSFSELPLWLGRGVCRHALSDIPEAIESFNLNKRLLQLWDVERKARRLEDGP